MIRVVVYLVIVALLAFGAVWFAERPGQVAITWQGMRIETSVMVLVAAVVALAVIVAMLWSLARAILRWPDTLARRRHTRRGARGYAAVSHGLVAVASGDMRAARKFAEEAKRIAPAEPLTLLLGAQTAQLAGDVAGAERTFHVMAGRADTKLLGLHGLYIEAQRRADPVAALGYAEQAAQHAAPPAWAGQAALEFRCATGDWKGALDRLERNMRSGLVDKTVYRRQRAVLMTAQALAVEERERARARELALEAVKLAPTLVPAAALAGRLLGEANETRKAARIIETAWKGNPHPDLADAYAHLRPGSGARERLERVQALAKLSPGSVEGALAVARAALDGQEFAIARAALAPLVYTPSQRVALLMAELEQTEHADEGRAREWMTRALAARRDPAWTADGFVSERWLPVSPVTGRLDAFQWRDPLSGLDGGAAMIESLPAPPGPRADKDQPLVLEASRAPTRAAPTPPAQEKPADQKPADEKPAETVYEPAPAPDAAPRARSPQSSMPVPLPPRIEKVIPLVHVPDDPGPDHEPIEPMPAPAAESQSEGWNRIRRLLKP